MKRMSKKTILMSVSLIALAFAVTPAHAEVSTGQKAENALERAGKAVENAASATKEAAKETYGDVKSYFSDDDNIELTSSLSVKSHQTASALIGTGVENAQGKKVGTIHDIVLDDDGEPEWLIIEDGGVLGLGGKLAAFNYDVMKGFNADKNAVVRLSENAVKNAKSFDYKAGASSTLATDEFSLNKILGADVLGPNGDKIADVENVVLEGAGNDDEYLIVAFDKVLGMGGERAALNLEALNIVKPSNADDDYKIQLTAQQSAIFKDYKKNGTTKSN